MAADEIPDEVPEADALDQRRPTSPADAEAPEVSEGFEVPEADALDQAREVPTDDEPDPEGA